MADGGIGEAALATEVMGAGETATAASALTPEVLGATGALGTVGGLGGLSTVGASAIPGLTGSGLAGLASAAPEAAAQTMAAQQAAAVGANQLAAAAPTEIAPNIQAGSAINTPYTLTQVPTPNLPSAMTMESAGTAAGASGNGIMDWWNGLSTPQKMLYGGSGLMAANTLFGPKTGGVPQPEKYSGPLSRFQYDPSKYNPTIAQQPSPYYQPTYQNYRSYADGGMLDAGANPGMQMQGGNDPLAFQSTGVERFADGGISSLGGYSDGGRMLKGPGDGMSDDIPATIADKQPARLANDEFVVPADVVSHLGNGSSDAGAKQLYKMMDRVRQARTGKKAQGKEINPDKYMPA